MTTVQELIDFLSLIKDKTQNVVVQIETGRSFSVCDDVSMWEQEIENDDGTNGSIVVIGGEETSFE